MRLLNICSLQCPTVLKLCKLFKDITISVLDVLHEFYLYIYSLDDLLQNKNI